MKYPFNQNIYSLIHAKFPDLNWDEAEELWFIIDFHIDTKLDPFDTKLDPSPGRFGVSNLHSAKVIYRNTQSLMSGWQLEIEGVIWTCCLIFRKNPSLHGPS